MSARSSTALNRGSSRGARGTAYGLESLMKYLASVGTLVGFLVAFVLAVIARNYETVTAQRGWNENLRHALPAGVVLAFAFASAGWITGEAATKSNSRDQMILVAILIAIALLVGLAFWYYFHRNEVSNIPFYATLIALVLAVVHTYMCFMACQLEGLGWMIPLLVILAYLTWCFWDDRKKC